MITVPLARRMFNDCRPFRVTLHFVGSNRGNASGHSSKWWSLEYDGNPLGRVECNHGRHGNSGRKEPFQYDLEKALKKATEKLGKGYSYDSRTLSSLPPMTAPMTAPKVTLTGPFALIRLVKKVADDHFKAFDDGGDFLLDLDAKGAQTVVDADPFRIEMQV